MGDSSACLYVVATPSGNLGDLSQRARQTLAEVDLIVAEDTRVTRRLLEHYSIRGELLSLASHNEAASTRRACRALESGKHVALVSDAGTPLLSDPGFELVRAAHEMAVKVHPVPGPSAITAALSVSGLPVRPFWFEGFLPPRDEARRSRLEALADIAATLVFFEAPHRALATLDSMVAVFGKERAACAARELTKLYEEIRCEPLGELVAWFTRHPPRGEFVLIVAGAESTPSDDRALLAVLEPLLDELPLRQAVALTVRITGEPRNRVYPLALAHARD